MSPAWISMGQVLMKDGAVILCDDPYCCEGENPTFPPTQCNRCFGTGDNAPTVVMATVSGVVGDNCTTGCCEELNGTFLLDVVLSGLDPPYACNWFYNPGRCIFSCAYSPTIGGLNLTIFNSVLTSTWWIGLQLFTAESETISWSLDTGVGGDANKPHCCDWDHLALPVVDISPPTGRSCNISGSPSAFITSLSVC